MRSATRLAVALLVLGGCHPVADPVEPGAVSGATAWKQLLETLPGRWRASIDGHPIEVAYRITSRGTVLLETWMPGTPAETVTTYHLDGEALMLTHYCGQGNQPRLRLIAPGPRLQFTRYDATDLQPDEPVLTRLAIEVSGTALTRKETYVKGEQRETSDLVFTRIAD